MAKNPLASFPEDKKALDISVSLCEIEKITGAAYYNSKEGGFSPLHSDLVLDPTCISTPDENNTLPRPQNRYRDVYTKKKPHAVTSLMLSQSSGLYPSDSLDTEFMASLTIVVFRDS